jgi:hypothetical protein
LRSAKRTAPDAERITIARIETTGNLDAARLCRPTHLIMPESCLRMRVSVRFSGIGSSVPAILSEC